MANTVAKKTKKPPANDPETPETPELQAETPPTPEKPKAKGGRPKKGEEPLVPPARNFFDRLKSIHSDDWGTRATVYLYRLEPFTDRLRSGTVVFIMKYEEPIDETRILMDHGSGRYRANLTFRKQSGTDTNNEIGRVEFELLNMKYPPKVPKGEWVDDPRNKKWSWARNVPREDGDFKPATPASELADTMRAFNEIQDSAVERAKGSTPDPLAFLKLAKELIPAPSSENGMFNAVVQLMTAQMTQQGALMQAQVSAANAQNQELRQEIRDMRTGVAGNGLDKIKEVVGVVKDLAPTLKDFFPALKEGAGALSGRSRMPGWMEFSQPIITGLLESPVAQAFGQMLVMKAMAPKKDGENGNAHQQPTAPPALHLAGAPALEGTLTMAKFFDIVWPSMRRHLEDETYTGNEFAAVTWDSYGCPYEGLNWLEQAQMAGAINITSAFKTSPYWPKVATIPGGEQRFATFVQEFLNFTPPPDEPGDEVIEVQPEATTK